MVVERSKKNVKNGAKNKLPAMLMADTGNPQLINRGRETMLMNSCMYTKCRSQLPQPVAFFCNCSNNVIIPFQFFNSIYLVYA